MLALWIVGGAAWMIYRNRFPYSGGFLGSGFDQLKKQAGAYYPDLAKNPMILRDDVMEKSFAAQKQTSIRLPFGPPNAFQTTVQDPWMSGHPVYNREYQKNIREIQFDTVDWRIDPKFNSSFNNYASMHEPNLDCLIRISKSNSNRRN